MSGWPTGVSCFRSVPSSECQYNDSNQATSISMYHSISYEVFSSLPRFQTVSRSHLAPCRERKGRFLPGEKWQKHETARPLFIRHSDGDFMQLCTPPPFPTYHNRTVFNCERLYLCIVAIHLMLCSLHCWQHCWTNITVSKENKQISSMIYLLM
jgi:hypothetical protein